MGLRRFGGPGMHGIGGVPLSSMGGGALGTYADKVMGTGPIAYWPLWETGGASAQCLVNSAQNGTAVGVAWANDNTNTVTGTPAPFFDGANDYVDIFTATFDAAFNGATGSAMIWFKVANAGAWTDGSRRDPLQIYDDASNYYNLRKSNVNNYFQYLGNAGGGIGGHTRVGCVETTWIHSVITWSDGAHADELISYWQGASLGPASAALNNWTGGGLSVANVCVGASSTAPNNPFHGWIQQVAVWDYVLSPITVANLAV